MDQIIFIVDMKLTSVRFAELFITKAVSYMIYVIGKT